MPHIPTLSVVPAMVFAVPALTLPAPAQAAERAAPDALVRAAVEGTVARMQADAASRSGDLAAITAVVRQQFVPHTDFARTTRLALGDAWGGASPEQRRELVAQFETLLVHTYALSLSQLREQRVDFRFTPALPGSNANDAVVRSRVLAGGDESQIDYRLYRGPDGWKIYDINMMGAWLIEVYRRQFGDIVARGGLDGLIRYLSDHNARRGAGT